MNLHQIRLIPESPWVTPWQADTLAGLLCWTCARTLGIRILEKEIIEPGLEGNPPFVLSDAFPEDWLPIPATLRLGPWAAEQRKSVKRARWLSRPQFMSFQSGRSPQLSELLPDDGIKEYPQLRNTIARATNTTPSDGGIYRVMEHVLGRDSLKRALEYLTVYVRIRDECEELFEYLLRELAAWGFGADRSAGKGQFRVGSGLEKIGNLDDVSRPTGCIVLSTFQPAPSDPTQGAWEVFTKYGKLGPDFGLENVFKRPLILLRPGASFETTERIEWLGRAVPMIDLLPEDAASSLEVRGARVLHWAFGLAVPMRQDRIPNE